MSAPAHHPRDHAALQARVRAFIDDDPDPACRAELQQLLDQQDFAELSQRFAGQLEFGTAGLRGELGAGPMRMNRAVVARATAGLCAHLRAVVKDAEQRGLCVGFDGRHMSRELAEETLAVAAGAGFAVHVFETPVPTPVLAFALLDRHAAGAVMITASHNPARDNGYKAYFENGAQIIPPHDSAIAAAMQKIVSVAALPRVSAPERVARKLQTSLGAALERRYLDGVLALSSGRCAHATGLRIAYTALHGVGERFARAALAQAGFSDVHSVLEQAEPNPDFPTVAFPNPEEKGAMDRVLALGERVGADLVLANDPDADRLAVAARAHDGKLRALTGNQVGVLLAEHALGGSDDLEADRAVLSSIVSTPMIAQIARAHGAHWEPTLTGFKWICNRALELEHERGARFVLGFEEALGYSLGTLVRDKDGISSAVAAACLAAKLKAEGRTLFDLLDELFARHGVHLSSQVSIRLEGADGAERREALMTAARASAPVELAGRKLTGTLDLATGATTGKPSFALALPKSDVLFWELEGGQRIIVRPSGTEPKIKLYLDVREPVAHGEPVAAARARAEATLEALATALRERMRSV
jgi:phosphomannomutase